MRVFVAGATGATGQAFVPAASARGLEQVVHVRPRSEERYASQQPDGPAPTVFDLDDTAALDAAMAGCDAVISMIGTMRRRFDSGDTYASSDVGTAATLSVAAGRAGVGHFVLLTAMGTAVLPGPYYDAKRQAEQHVKDSGVPWTMVRPSALVGNGRGSSAALIGGGLRTLPGLGGIVDDWRGIPVEVVARAMARILAEGSHRGAVVRGRTLWQLGEE